MKLFLALLAAAIAIAGNVPYIRAVLQKRVQPHPYTWLVGAFVSSVVLVAQLQQGAGVGAIPTATSELFTITIFILSLRYGFKNATRTDQLFLVAALLGLIPWFITRDPTLSVVIAVTVDIASFVPTIRKTWLYPKTESPLLYFSNIVRHVLALIALQAYTIATALHSVAMIILNIGMVLLVYRRGTIDRGRHSRSHVD